MPYYKHIAMKFIITVFMLRFLVELLLKAGKKEKDSTNE